jgi:uncharacterized coiled-coil protein SlyX
MSIASEKRIQELEKAVAALQEQVAALMKALESKGKPRA